MSHPTRPQLSGSYGMVAATHWLAAASGMAMLERGGNAFDAAVAAGLVLQVVEPHLNGPGGEVPIIIYDARRDAVEVICGQGPLPGAARTATLRDMGLRQVPGTGLLPACVPGAFGAWMTLLEGYGRLELAEVMEPAIGYAGGGFPLLDRAAATIASRAEMFRRHWPTSAEVYLAGGPPVGGRHWSNPVLADAFSRIVGEAATAKGGREGRIAKARDVFYQGFVAEAVDAYMATARVLDDSGAVHAGLLRGSDMAAWQPRIEAPLHVDYGGMRVHKTGPWGQGMVFLQALRILEGLDLEAGGPTSAEFAHLVVEASKLAFADREAFYGDPLFVDVPVAELLSGAYATARRQMIGDSASFEDRPGSPGGRSPWIADPLLLGLVEPPGGDGGTGGGAPPDPTGRDTCQLDVVDRHGNMVAATPSGAWLHGGPCVPGLGFSLSTRGQMCWLDESAPAAFGPGRRPRTTLTPTLVLGPDQRLAFGTPGGDQQDQWTLIFFLRRALFGLSLQQAIDLPTFHTSHLLGSFHPRRSHPGRLHAEVTLGQPELAALRRRGHQVVEEEGWSLGRICAVARRGQELLGGADARHDQAYVVGR